MLRTCSPRTLRYTSAMALSLMLGSIALPAQAISVNDMVVWSASNKPLRMDIELVDLQAANLREIKLSVASAAEHARIGLTRPVWADSVSFKVIVLDSGKVIARATSSAAVDANFVSFLVSIRAANVSQLQQVASKVLANGAEPLASADAAPLAARAEKAPTPAPVSAAATAFADKPAVKPVLVLKPTPVEKPMPASKAAPATKPAPVAVLPAAPAPLAAALAAAAAADNAEVLADVGTEPTLESLQAERTQLLQQATDTQARLTDLDQQIAALNPEAMPATETPTALAEAETSPAEPVASQLLGYTYFSNILLGLLAFFISGMVGLDRLASRLR